MVAPKPAPPPRNAERSRRRLLTAATRLFAHRGYHGVSVDQIVAAARLNKRMVYHYFGSKDAIFRAVLQEVYGRIETVEFAAVAAERTAREQLEQLLRSYFRFLDDNTEFTQLLLWENLERGRHLRGREPVLSKNPFFTRFREVVAAGVAAGEFRDDLDSRQLLIHFIGLCFIYHSNRYSLSQALDVDLGDPRVRAAGLKQVLTLVFQGIRR
jgi:TetR/AcrR family transcriptional regulator